MKEQNLFGDAAEYVNTLEAEITVINNEIEAAHNAIEKKEDKIEALKERRVKLIEVRDALVGEDDESGRVLTEEDLDDKVRPGDLMTKEEYEKELADAAADEPPSDDGEAI